MSSTHIDSKEQSGQVILTLLVITALGLTLGLMIISRSTVDIELSSKLEREARVFSANEAGIEDVLVNPLAPGKTRPVKIGEIDVVEAAIPPLDEGDPFVFPDDLAVGSTQTIWLVPHGPAPDYVIEDGSIYYDEDTIDMCWSKESAVEPGVVVALLYKEGSTGLYKIARNAFRYKAKGSQCGKNKQKGDCFSDKGIIRRDRGGLCDPDEPDLIYRKRLDFTTRASGDFGVDRRVDILVALRIRPVYSNIRLGFKPPEGKALPQQAITDAIVSAQAPETGEATKIRIFYSYPFAPPLFDYVLFSGRGLSHQ